MRKLFACNLQMVVLDKLVNFGIAFRVENLPENKNLNYLENRDC